MKISGRSTSIIAPLVGLATILICGAADAASSGGHRSSYGYFMQQVLFDHVNVNPDRIHLPDGKSNDVPVTCADYERSISAAGGIEGPISAMWPATILQTHPSVVVLLDEAAAAGLEQKNYYREVAENKPDWQKI